MLLTQWILTYYYYKLERLQNLCIRFVFGLRKYDHVPDHRRQLGWLPIRLRHNYHMLTLLYSINDSKFDSLVPILFYTLN